MTKINEKISNIFKEMFKLTDLNGDGFITVDEFVKVDQIVNATAAKEAEKKFNMVGEMTELKNKDRISEDEWVSGSMVQTKIVPPEMLENFMLPQIMATLEQMREKLKDNSSSE